jgi:hypothetical protein
MEMCGPHSIRMGRPELVAPFGVQTVRPLLVSLLFVVVCVWVGFSVRETMPNCRTALYTLAVLVGTLGVGGFYGLY